MGRFTALALLPAAALVAFAAVLGKADTPLFDATAAAETAAATPVEAVVILGALGSFKFFSNRASQRCTESSVLIAAAKVLSFRASGRHWRRASRALWDKLYHKSRIHT